MIERGIDGVVEALNQSRRALRRPIMEAVDAISTCFARGGKLLICGNGGSAADAQHLAAEFVGRFKSPERPGLPALALCTDTSVLTAWANDVGFEQVFARQVETLGREGDVLVGISTSGRSPNVIQAFEAARQRGIRTIALLGGDGGQLCRLADVPVIVPSADTQHIQEVHTVVIHIMSELIEARLLAGWRGVQTPPAARAIWELPRRRAGRRSADRIAAGS